MKIDADLAAALRANATQTDAELIRLVRWHIAMPDLATMAAEEIVRRFRESHPAPAAKPSLTFITPDRPRGPR
jgi:hypothetical protein